MKNIIESPGMRSSYNSSRVRPKIFDNNSRVKVDSRVVKYDPEPAENELMVTKHTKQN